jgi:hypothetical protein
MSLCDTTDPPGRAAAMRIARPDIRLLGDIPGDRETEKALQQRFSEDRIGGEADNNSNLRTVMKRAT